MRSENDCIELSKHWDTLFSEFVSQCESGLFLTASLCPGDRGPAERCHLALLLAASELLRSIVTETGLVEEEHVTLILPDVSKQELVSLRKCLYRKEENEAMSDIFTMLGIKTPFDRKMSLAEEDIGAPTVETLMTFNLPSGLSHPHSVVDLKDISIEDLNSSLINNTTASPLINTIHVNKVGVTDDAATVQIREPTLDNQQKVSTKSDVPRTFQCDVCFKKLATEKKLQSHRSRVHPSMGKNASFKCSECDLNLASANSLEIHLRSHSGHRPFPCSECEKSFASLHYLSQHKEFHRKTKDFECDICFKRYQNSNALSQHKVDNHSHSNVKYECGLCLKLFSAKRYLKEHEKKKHGDGSGLKYDCDICGKKLSGKNELKIHSRIHSGEKPYHCSECNKHFRARSTFTIHMKSHSGTKNAVCEECGKRFIQWGDLRKHMRTHTGERPFQCTACDRSFARKDYLIKHEKTHRKKKSDKGFKGESGVRVTSITVPAENVDSENVVIDMSDLRTFVTDTDGNDIQVVRILDPGEARDTETLKAEGGSVMYVITS